MTARLLQVLEGYLELRWHMDPVEATAAGRHEFDAKFADYSRGAVREQIAALKSYAASLEEVDAESLEDEIDRTAALHAARHDILVAERERPFIRDPAFHLAHALTGIHLLLADRRQGSANQWTSLLGRLQALPEFLAQAMEIVAEPRAVFVDLAQAMLPDGMSLLREEPDDADAGFAELDPAELESARAAATDALLEFEGWLVRIAERAAPDVAIGRDLYDRKLHTAHMIQESADELLRLGERWRREASCELDQLAGAMQRGAHWHDVAEQLTEHSPAADDAIETVTEALRAARAFTLSSGILQVPESDPNVVATPGFLRPVIPVSAYRSSGPFTDAREGTLFLSLPDIGEKWPLPAHVVLESVAVREGIPGQHLHELSASELPRSVRRVLRAPVTREGWSAYCETLLAETGYTTISAQPFTQAYAQLRDACRLIVDVSLHTHGMSVAEAVSTLRDALGVDAAVARSEVWRCCARPTYGVCAAVGRRDLLRLRDDARNASGENFSLAEFHKRLLAYGALPTTLARWGMGL